MATTLLRRRIFRQTANLLVPKRGSYRHHAGLFLLGSMVTTATTRTSTTAFCQDENGLPKDSDGNIDWMKSLTKVGNTSFWHEIATVAGSKVRESEILQISSSHLYVVASLDTLKLTASVLFMLHFFIVCI